MKKFLILMLVLGMVSAASAASATFYALINGSATYDTSSGTNGVQVDLYCNKDLSQVNKIDFTSTAGQLSVGDWVPGASIDDNGSLSGVNIVDASWNKAGGAPNHSADTIIYSFTVNIDNGGLISPLMNAGDVAAKGLITYPAASNTFTPVTIIPEPMTIALLGLGGLFLRRKK